jgi:hypothetical protein
MAIALKQSATGATTANTATSVAATFGSATTGGNTIIIAFAGGISTISGVSDGGTNTYTKAVSDDTYSDVEIWYCSGIVGHAAPTITASFVAAMAGTIYIYEYSGLLTSAALDKTIAAHGDGATSNTPTGTTAATTQASELVFAACGAFTGSGTDLPTVGAGYGDFLVTNSTPTTGQTISGAAQDKTVSATGTQTATFGLAFSTTTWEMAIATFKASAGGSAVVTAF